MAALSISNDSKNQLDVTNEEKAGSTITWDQATFTWDESDPSTWGSPRVPIDKEAKNSLSISNEAKN